MTSENAVLAGDKNVQRHLTAVERLLRVVCDDDEYPWFVSDEATVFDVSTASEAELAERIAAAFGHVATADDLHLPLWQLATKLPAARLTRDARPRFLFRAFQNCTIRAFQT